jgi:glutamate/tyrosine decarboxylase-like PLP-dependent enzyme
MLVGSAPCYPHGLIDPIEEIAALAAERGLLCHVDACMGGFLLPFLERLGRPVRPFDLTVEGVTSISADIHKYGYASKGASIVLYANRELARRQVFVTDDWSGGFYGSTVLAGSRPAGPVAAAWATLQHLGLDGYLELAAATMAAADELMAGVAAIDGLRVLGAPDMAVLAIGAEDPDALDVFAVGDRLKEAGWWLDRQAGPDALHLTLHAGSAPAVPSFLADLAAAVAAVGGERALSRDTTYATPGGADDRGVD